MTETAIDPRFPESIAHQLTQGGGLQYREEAFELRAGGESNWYFDTKLALALGQTALSVGNLSLRTVRSERLNYSHLCAMGSGGKILMFGMVMSAVEDYNESLLWTDAYEGKPDDPDNGLGGADVAGEEVLLVDDVLSTGHSLLTTADMIEAAGGRVTNGLVLLDRSHGIAIKRMKQKRNITIRPLFRLSESKGMIVPAKK